MNDSKIKKKLLGLVLHTFSHSTREVEAKKSQSSLSSSTT